ncbi:hypothetical protein R1sor_022779 [Riccia sorocarpa]|uniref:Palmitoyl-protein hydrolase n=1 Tax=Riccia sorocarpa TaxID=122646 RepID=A0ABD3GLL2_9MARC
MFIVRHNYNFFQNKQRFSSLNYLALIKFEAVRVLYPTDTAWFGFYAPNDFRKVLPAEETDLYKEDWIGLKALNEAGKVAFLSVPGGHLAISVEEIQELVVPFLLPDFSSSRIPPYY